MSKSESLNKEILLFIWLFADENVFPHLLDADVVAADLQPVETNGGDGGVR